MTIDLTDTTTSKIDDALTQARRRIGSPAMGMVLTLVIVTDEREHHDAVRAATEAGREHPCRVLAVIPRGVKVRSRLDAEIRVGGSSPGETVLLRLHGPLGHHADSVLTPLLLPDAPVVAWWPSRPPDVPAEDPVGALAQRRITDAAAASKPPLALLKRSAGYHDGDTDMAWTRLTPWRALLAAALDQPYDEIQRGSVHAARHNPSGELLAAWLAVKLGVPIERRNSRGPGITAARLKLRRGEIAIRRQDGRLATLSKPAQPDRRVALHRRDAADLLMEELRRLDEDEVYAEVLRRAASDIEDTPAARGRTRPARHPR